MRALVPPLAIPPRDRWSTQAHHPQGPHPPARVEGASDLLGVGLWGLMHLPRSWRGPSGGILLSVDVDLLTCNASIRLRFPGSLALCLRRSSSEVPGLRRGRHLPRTRSSTQDRSKVYIRAPKPEKLLQRAPARRTESNAYAAPRSAPEPHSTRDHLPSPSGAPAWRSLKLRRRRHCRAPASSYFLKTKSGMPNMEVLLLTGVGDLRRHGLRSTTR